MAQSRKPGPTIDRHKELGPLHDLLLKVCVPEKKTRKKSITVLARQIGVTPWAIYKWVHGRHPVPPAKVRQMVDAHEAYAKKVGGLPPRERVTLRDFERYVFG